MRIRLPNPERFMPSVTEADCKAKKEIYIFFPPPSKNGLACTPVAPSYYPVGTL